MSSTAPPSTEDHPQRVDLPARPDTDQHRERHRVAWQPVALTLIVLGTVSINLWWVASHRRGLPFDIDEAGYLQRAVRDADALHSGGLVSLWSTVRLPDPQAPLLTVVAGVFRWTTGAGTLSMFAVLQIFFVVTVVATYLGCRRLANRNWSLVAAILVAALPGVVNGSRAFWFALPAVAMITATLVAQLYSDEFRSRGVSALWGLFLALSALSRTVVLALLPAMIVPAIVVVAVSRPSRRQLSNLGMALVIGLLVAGSWYSATWREVLHYLTGYGYGTQANRYGSGHSIASFGWWTSRLVHALDTEVFAPMAAALTLCFVAGAVSLLYRRRQVRGRTSVPSGTPPFASAARRTLRRPEAVLWMYVVLGYLVLSTSQNSGSMFELPLLPAVCMLAVSVAGRSARAVRPYVAALCMLAAAVSFAGASGAIDAGSSSSVSVGPIHVTAFDGRGTYLAYASGTGGACEMDRPCVRSGTMPGENAYLQRWLRPSAVMASFLHSYSGAHGCDPVVFFAVEDPLFNTNTVDLSYQLAFAQSLPTGLFKARHDVNESPIRELNDPAHGVPNFVITGPVSPYSPTFYPLVRPSDGERALVSDGFVPVKRLQLPDGRIMRVWWLDRGPCGARPS